MKYDFEERKDMERMKKKNHIFWLEKNREKKKKMEGMNFHENHPFFFPSK